MTHAITQRIGWLVAGMALAAVLWLAARCAIGRDIDPPVDAHHSDARETLTRERIESEDAHREVIEEYEQELQRIRADRLRLQRLLDELQRLALAALACVFLVFLSSPARAQDRLEDYGRIVDGHLCVPASLARDLLVAYEDTPRLRLQVKALSSDRALAQREIHLLEGLRTQTDARLGEALAREQSWQKIAAAMDTRIEALESRIQRTQRKRAAWISTAAAVIGAAILVTSATR